MSSCKTIGHLPGEGSVVCAEAVAHMIRTKSVAILPQVSWMPCMCECLEPCGSCNNGAGDSWRETIALTLPKRS